MFDIHAKDWEDKLALLLMLDQLGGCTQTQLERFAVEAEIMDPFRLSLAYRDMLGDGLVREARHGAYALIVLTPDGRQTLTLFGDQLRASMQEKVTANASRWRQAFREERERPASWSEEGGNFIVRLRALEEDEETLSIAIRTANRRQAVQFCARWRDCAPEIYQTILDRLGEEQQATEE